jgi:hypothetical protein
LGPFAFGSFCWVIYFAINVVWCLLFPGAGFNWLLTEEEKKGKFIYSTKKEGGKLLSATGTVLLLLVRLSRELLLGPVPVSLVVKKGGDLW